MFDAPFPILLLFILQMDAVAATPARIERELDWTPETKARVDQLVEAKPVLKRICAASNLGDATKRSARRNDQHALCKERFDNSARHIDRQPPEHHVQFSARHLARSIIGYPHPPGSQRVFLTRHPFIAKPVIQNRPPVAALPDPPPPQSVRHALRAKYFDDAQSLTVSRFTISYLLADKSFALHERSSQRCCMQVTVI